jgi:hypothetical protein
MRMLSVSQQIHVAMVTMAIVTGSHHARSARMA